MKGRNVLGKNLYDNWVNGNVVPSELDSIASKGRGGDNTLREIDGEFQHVNSLEANLIDTMGDKGKEMVKALTALDGGATINPETGLKENILGILAAIAITYYAVTEGPEIVNDLLGNAAGNLAQDMQGGSPGTGTDVPIVPGPSGTTQGGSPTPYSEPAQVANPAHDISLWNRKRPHLGGNLLGSIQSAYSPSKPSKPSMGKSGYKF